MGKLERAVIRHSVNDVIRVLENEPVRPDMIVELTAAQVMNRVSIAHLSIERAMKFVITEAGGPLVKDHDLPSRLNELRQYEQDSAKFLEEAFEDAVLHYRYNANATHMKHLKSLDTYLEATGSDDRFQDIRYWELTQSTNEMILRTIYLTLHIELLYALREILLVSKSPKVTVSGRVERTIQRFMRATQIMVCTEGSEKERSVRSYLEWLNGFDSCGKALAEAVRNGVPEGDGLILEVTSKAFQELAQSKDPAVRYFAEILTVLPKQQRNAIPCVEWVGTSPYQMGIVSTPGGDELGDIRRRTDGLWNITPSVDGPASITAIAESQTDARSYLADLLTRPARLIVENAERGLRIVGEELNIFETSYYSGTNLLEDIGRNAQSTSQVTFWDDAHGIKVGDAVRLEVLSTKYPGIMDVLEGTVTELQGQKVSIHGTPYADSAI